VLWPGKIPANSKNHDIVGGLDLMATFASFAGVKLPENDLEGKPTIFDSYDLSPVFLGTGKDQAWGARLEEQGSMKSAFS